MKKTIFIFLLIIFVIAILTPNRNFCQFLESLMCFILLILTILKHIKDKKEGMPGIDAPILSGIILFSTFGIIFLIQSGIFK